MFLKRLCKLSIWQLYFSKNVSYLQRRVWCILVLLYSNRISQLYLFNIRPEFKLLYFTFEESGGFPLNNLFVSCMLTVLCCWLFFLLSFALCVDTLKIHPLTSFVISKLINLVLLHYNVNLYFYYRLSCAFVVWGINTNSAKQES